jgi:hypothetical protein
MNPNKFENEIKIEFIMFALFVEEVSGNALIEPLKEVMNPNKLENKIKIEFIMFALFVEEVSGNALIEPLKEVSVMLEEFKDICSSKLL